MIMPAGRPLLLPANPRFIAMTVVLGLLSDMGLRQNIIQSHRGDDPAFLNTAWTVQIIRGFVLFALTLLLALCAPALAATAAAPSRFTAKARAASLSALSTAV